MKFYAIYVTTNQTGNSKKFATVEQDNLSFPPNVKYDGSNYRYTTAYTVSTPSQEKQFRSYCKDNSIETDVSI